MSCNPAIGGVAKGQIVREIDALGGAMGRAIDATGIQFRMLNRSKGPAMHGPRAQADKRAYQQEVKRLCRGAAQPLPCGKRPSRTCWSKAPARHRRGSPASACRRRASTAPGRRPLRRHLPARACCTSASRPRPAGGWASRPRPASAGPWQRLGFRLARFKTGTPPRLDGRTIDYDEPNCSPATTRPSRSRFSTTASTAGNCPAGSPTPSRQCTRSSAPTCTGRRCTRGQIQVDRAALLPLDRDQDRPLSPTDSGTNSFSNPKAAHAGEVYVNGLSTSLPRDVQDVMLALIPGPASGREIVRYGYAIEYDYLPPEQLQPSLETQAGGRASSSPGRSTAPPATKRPPPRDCWPGTNAALAAARPRAAAAAPRRGLHRRDDRRPGHPRRR